jgi:cytochrome P450
MTITFLSYDAVHEVVRVRLDDPNKPNPDMQDFTVFAFNHLIDTNDPKFTEQQKKIRQAFIDKGGKNWLLKEIQSYQRKQLSGQG